MVAAAVDQGRADHHRHARAVLADVVLLVGFADAGCQQAFHGARVGGAVLVRGHVPPRDAAGLEVVARVADHLQERVVRVGDRAGLIPEHEPDHAGAEDAAPARLAVAQCLLGGAPLGDVARDADGPGDAAVLGAQRRGVGLDPTPGAAEPLDLELDRDGVAAEHALGEGAAGRAVGIDRQHVEPDLADVGRPRLDQAEAGGVEVEDGAVARDHGDRVRAGFEDRAQAGFALGELAIGLRDPVDVGLQLADPGGRRNRIGRAGLSDVIAGGHLVPSPRMRHLLCSLAPAGRADAAEPVSLAARRSGGRACRQAAGAARDGPVGDSPVLTSMDPRTRVGKRFDASFARAFQSFCRALD